MELIQIVVGCLEKFTVRGEVLKAPDAAELLLYPPELLDRFMVVFHSNLVSVGYLLTLLHRGSEFIQYLVLFIRNELLALRRTHVELDVDVLIDAVLVHQFFALLLEDFALPGHLLEMLLFMDHA